MTFLIFFSFFHVLIQEAKGLFIGKDALLYHGYRKLARTGFFGEKSDSRVLASLAVDETSPLTLAVRIGCQDSVPLQGVCILSTEPFLPNRYVPGVGVSALLLAS